MNSLTGIFKKINYRFTWLLVGTIIFRKNFFKNIFSGCLLWYLPHVTQRSNSSIITTFTIRNPSARSSHQKCSVRKCILRNFAKSTRKHLCQSAIVLKCQCWNQIVLLPFFLFTSFHFTLIIFTFSKDDQPHCIKQNNHTQIKCFSWEKPAES